MKHLHDEKKIRNDGLITNHISKSCKQTLPFKW